MAYQSKINPQHYQQGNRQCIDIIKDMGHIKSFCAGNVIKYVYRYENKNGVEDLKKAQWYLQRLIQEIEIEELKNNNG